MRTYNPFTFAALKITEYKILKCVKIITGEQFYMYINDYMEYRSQWVTTITYRYLEEILDYKGFNIYTREYSKTTFNKELDLESLRYTLSILEPIKQKVLEQNKDNAKWVNSNFRP